MLYHVRTILLPKVEETGQRYILTQVSWHHTSAHVGHIQVELYSATLFPRCDRIVLGTSAGKLHRFLADGVGAECSWHCHA